MGGGKWLGRCDITRELINYIKLQILKTIQGQNRYIGMAIATRKTIPCDSGLLEIPDAGVDEMWPSLVTMYLSLMQDIHQR
jgi:hypothetical protein